MLTDNIADEQYFEIAKSIGIWLENNKYIGHDVCSMSEEICSSALAFSLRGWLNLYKISQENIYLKKAENCASLIIKLQNKDGSWPFPWKFRNNPVNHSYACENMFTAIGLLDLYSITNDKHLVDSVLSVKNYLINTNGFVKLSDNNYCLWYSTTDKVRIPNIGAIAGHLFSKLFSLQRNPEDKNLAIGFTNFAISAQRNDGSTLYWLPPNNLDYQNGENYSYDIRNYGNSISGLSRICYIPYHSLTIFEVAEAYNIIHDEALLEYVLKSARYLSTLINHNKQLKEMITNKKWEKHYTNDSIQNEHPVKLLRKYLSRFKRSIFTRNDLVCTAKNISWTTKAFSFASRYDSKYFQPTKTALDFFINHFYDDIKGGVYYHYYGYPNNDESNKYVRGSAIAFESITNFLLNSHPR
jgi:uncharacterized protein YyaL (SSP411 family)